MTARPVTAAQLRAYVDKARRDDARVVGFRAAPVWTENGSLGDGVVVAACPSTLAVRAAVWDHLDADDGRLLVVLTDRDDIGAEVVARLYRRQLLQPEAYEILKDLFRVSEIHQSLRDHQWLADLLVDVAPVGRTFAPPPGGILDLDIAWRALLTKHADRFMVGTDTWVNEQWDNYAELIAKNRAWLAQFPKHLAEGFAYGNAERLFGRKAGRDLIGTR